MEIKVYSTPSCPWCAKVKSYLKSKAIAFEDIDVSTNREGAAEMVRKSGQRGVPVLDIKGEIVVGFNQSLIDKLINA